MNHVNGHPTEKMLKDRWTTRSSAKFRILLIKGAIVIVSPSDTNHGLKWKSLYKPEINRNILHKDWNNKK